MTEDASVVARGIETGNAWAGNINLMLEKQVEML
jgi:hypothetical protein